MDAKAQKARHTAVTKLAGEIVQHREDVETVLAAHFEAVKEGLGINARMSDIKHQACLARITELEARITTLEAWRTVDCETTEARISGATEALRRRSIGRLKWLLGGR